MGPQEMGFGARVSGEPMWRGSLLPLDFTVGAAEGCDLLIFRLKFKCLGKDRSLVALDSSYTAQREQACLL
ncbi:hypothetical protein, partial [Pseudomonas brassicacearum]|uniref:hypothetical protein n=1 Tax=Pseudomonas brassicacearum TaxID=930166 RepID=UPI001E3DFE2A